MIPKIIHYVWVGGAEKNALTLKCIDSWKKYMPDYSIVEWNESNFDIGSIPFAREAYDNKKWAFVSDVMRAYAVYTQGGVYFDTDLEVLRAPNEIFENAAVVGFENKWLLAGHVLAAEPGHEIFHRLYEQYLTEQFLTGSGMNQKTVTRRLTEIVCDYTQRKYLPNDNYKLDELSIFEQEIFTAHKTTAKSFAIHHFKGSWKDRVSLTKWQWTTLRAKLKILGYMYPLRGNVKTIAVEDAIWEREKELTRKNKEKGKRTHITL